MNAENDKEDIGIYKEPPYYKKLVDIDEYSNSS